MHFSIFTLFPEFFKNFFQYSIFKRGIEKNIFNASIHNIRDYGIGNYNKVDDYCYGGGSGMLIRHDVLENSFLKNAIINDNSKTIFLSPRGKTLNKNMVDDLIKFSHLNLVSANYEGIDQRFIDKHVDLEISIGDYILTGGDLPIMVLLNTVCRFLENFLDNGSLEEESFNHDLLEYDQYTKSNFLEEKVPLVLKNGNHKQIKNWQKENSLINTFSRRIDLWKKYPHDKKEVEIIKEYLFSNYANKINENKIED